MIKKPTKLQRTEIDLERANRSIQYLNDEVNQFDNMVIKLSQRPTVEEFTELKKAWNAQQHDIKDLMEQNLDLKSKLEATVQDLAIAEHSFTITEHSSQTNYETSHYAHLQIDKLKSVIFKYEIFTISVVALTAIHVLWLSL